MMGNLVTDQVKKKIEAKLTCIMKRLLGVGGVRLKREKQGELIFYREF